MRIVIEIPEEFEADYNVNRFSDFFSRVMTDIDYNGICGNYEQETADVLAKAFKNSRVIQEVAYKGGRLVDADKLYNDLADKLKWLMGYGDGVYLSVGNDIRCAVANQPTTYDPGKVAQQLEEHTAFLKDCTKYGNKTADQQSKSYDTMMMYEVKDLVDDLLEIVKAGGTDGN